MNRPSLALVLPLLAALAGCASNSGKPGSGTTITPTTSVTLLAGSTANGQLYNFTLELQSITLTSQDGTNVPLMAAPVGDEYIHVNGSAEPLATNSVPQGVYTSATAKVSFVDPACVGPFLYDGALSTIQTTEYPPTTVTLPQPITVSGSAMALVLDLQVAKSVPFSGGCNSSLTGNISVAPIFNLLALDASGRAADGAGNRFYGMVGVLHVPSGGQMTINALTDTNGPNSPVWDVAVSSSTVYQGVIGSSELISGLPVDFDATLQSNGSLLISRIEVLDTNAANVGVAYGPVFAEWSGYPNSMMNFPNSLQAVVTQFSGDVFSQSWNEYVAAGDSFSVSQQMSNLDKLPFTPAFDASSVVDGQNVLVVSHAQRGSNGFPPGPPLPVTSMTLMPQTIDGTISAIGSAGGFTTFTVTLADYDLFPVLASQGGQTPQPSAPNTIVVYADANTRGVDASVPTVGTTFRFTGLVFNDNGVLRMDCAQIATGVPQ